ncbi:uncharacterized protein LOC125029298 [Penaeus chinensis]|uniref:uncharacterized protein LOC125029298 n=1 Tax=Penaeus chinensis TaxID=139456 RepID=UPI001FB73C7E|nr:uncharacterized protein LOC125029298 [Penaeus chinensis]
MNRPIMSVRNLLLLALVINCFALFFISTHTQVPCDVSDSSDSHKVFRQRREHLQERCRGLNLTDKFTTKTWVNFLTAEAPGPLKVCLPPKAGSSSWFQLNKKLKVISLTQSHPATAILVRHPLSRLTSAYRDKYLDGAPISEYTDEWRNRTDSPSSWNYNWFDYWLPTLIASGHLIVYDKLLEQISEYLEIFNFIAHNSVYHDKKLVITKDHDYDEVGVFIGTQMINAGRQMGLQNVIMNTYSESEEQLKRRFGTYSFTFKEFLEFVIWSDKLGITDIHWTPYTELCAPCLLDYQYILHLETIDTESKVLLQDVGYPKDIKLTTKHKTKGLTKSLHKDDLQYYKHVPKNLMDKILKLYESDFQLFGYSKNFLNV